MKMRRSKKKSSDFYFDQLLFGKKKIVPASKNSYLLLNPATMKNLQLCKGSLVSLHTENGQLLFKCWPCLSLDLFALMLPSMNLFSHYTKGHVLCTNYPLIVDTADSVSLKCDNMKPFMKTNKFLIFMKNQLKHTYIKEGLILNISFLGYACYFTVMKIISKDSDEISHQDSLTDICSDISALNINEDEILCAGDGESFICSTPISSKESQSQRSLLYKDKNLSSVHKKNIDHKSEHFYTIHPQTKIVLQPLREQIPSANKISFNDLCGLEKQVDEIKSLMVSFLNQEKSFEKQSHGIIFVGASGTGKSAFVQALGNEYCLPIFRFNGIGYDRNDIECKMELKKLFDEVVDNSPSILILEDIDELSRRDNNSNLNSELRLVHVLSNMMHDILESQNNVLIIGMAHSISTVDASLRKPGTLEKEIFFGIPSINIRKEILRKLLCNKCHKISSIEIEEISKMTHGFTGGDLKLLCDKADILSSERKNETGATIIFEDMKETLKKVKPSSMAEFVLEVPNVKWSDIGGMHAVKAAVIEMVDWPLNHAEQFRKLGITPSRGILMYGPPGCSKTMIAKALVSESHLNFISIKGPQLFNKYVGESEKAVSELFKKARSAAPCVLFFDEIDSLASVRGSLSGNSNVAERVLTQLLVEIDGIDVLQGVSIIAATNRPDLIDPSFLRPGRFDQMIYVPLPDSATRKEIFEAKLRNMPHSADVTVSYLVEATDGYTGAEITDVCREAAMSVIKDYITSESSELKMHHFLSALKSVVPRTSKEMIQFYVNYNKRKWLIL